MNTPRATYRLQFTRDFGFDAAARVAPYLARLGISHVYASPWLKARPGSTHGYDIVAHDQLNPELGDEAAFRRMNETFARHGLKQILDFVPNHMGVGGADNPFWLEVLEWGPLSPYAGWFDIDWEPSNRYLTEKLLVPILGDQYGAVLEDGDLVLRYDEEAGEFAVWAYDTHKLPICPLQYSSILGDEHEDLERLGDEFCALMEWRPQMERRANELKQELAALLKANQLARTSLDRALDRLNGRQDLTRPELDTLIRAQYWRASHFRVAGDDINYRRFFNVNDLAGLRIELPEVFEHAHGLVFRLLREGVIEGLRIDHIDGLLDPAGYLRRLREQMPRPHYLIVEKILARSELLPAEWPVDGTTGYEFANLVAQLLLDARAEKALTQGYQEFTGERRAFVDIVHECKIRIMKNEMASELHVLARDAARLARQNPRTADFTRHILQRAIRELIACFPVYRTYLNSQARMPDAESAYLRSALALARASERDVDPSVFDFLEALLTGTMAATPRSGFSRHAVLRCAMKLQQYSGPVMAKGFEDTALYRYTRLMGLNEVGGSPDQFGITVADFHAANRIRFEKWPHCMLATATHDTKRGEDARVRLLALSCIPDEWFTALRAWSAMLREASTDLGDANTEYLFYQTLVAGWPADGGVEESFRQRVRDVMRKSVREAKLRTTWAAPGAAYEGALMRFVDAAFGSRAFLESFVPFQRRVAELSVPASLAQTVLKLTAPGVPDLYQGCELWDYSFVDPDNRRPVDFVRREELFEMCLAEWAESPVETIRARLAAWQDGSIKLLLTALLLRCRAEQPPLFAEGEYQPCEITGENSEHVCGFARVRDAQCALVIVALPRGSSPSRGFPAGTRMKIPAAFARFRWRNIFTATDAVAGEYFEFDQLPADLGVAVLVSGQAPVS
jgi:(1->4)-alpha-D-glucan 1-alpha-D-glucosylmutase